MSYKGKRFILFLGGREFFLFLIISFLLYGLIERTGLFGPGPASWREIFHSIPSRIIGSVIIFHGVIALYITAENRALTRKVEFILFYIAVIFMASGLWLSFFTRFEGKVVRYEGQTVSGFRADYIQQTLYMGSHARLPGIGMTIKKIHVKRSGDRERIASIRADINITGPWTDRVIESAFDSGWPLFHDWTFVTMSDFGYAPMIVLSAPDGEVMESKFVPLRLFPPGTEDAYEPLFLGYVFYLRFYPNYEDDHKNPPSGTAEPENPVYRLRIVRNKDIVFNDILKPSEKLRFDNTVVSFPDVRPWIELSYVRDPGLFLALFGTAVLIISVVVMVIRD